MRLGARTRTLAVAAAGLLAGCGSSSSSGGEATKDAGAILADSVQALRQAGPLHMTGDIVSSGMRIQLDLDIAAKDTVNGTFTIDGTPVRITILGGSTYLAGRQFWNKLDSSGKAANLFGERCVLLPPTLPGAASILSNVNQISDLDTLADSLVKARGTATKGSPTTIGGRDAIPIRQSDSTVYVATDGKPYPLRVEMVGADNGHIDLGYGRTVSITPPPDCLDVSRLTSPG